MTKLVQKLAARPYVRRAIAEEADLSAFREPPTVRILMGVFLIGFSYVVGWPLIGFLGTLSVYFKNPFIVAVGGPVALGLSHLVFMAGMYLSGAKYTEIFLRWLTRVAVLKLSERYPAS
jgi:hypothetical protein